MKPADRILYRGHELSAGLLQGPGLDGLCERWSRNFLKKLDALPIGDEWTEMEDFMHFFEEIVGQPIVEAICGPLLFQESPEFMEDLKIFDLHVPYFLKALPRWLLPRAYGARDRLRGSLKRWHARAIKESAENQAVQEVTGGADPWFGSEFMRKRQHPDYGVFASHKDFDTDARALADLGFIWGWVPFLSLS